MEEDGRDRKGDDEGHPHAFGAKTEGAYPQPLPKGKGVIKCRIYSEGQGDTYIGEEGDTHGDAYILNAPQHGGSDTLESVGKLEERA